MVVSSVKTTISSIQTDNVSLMNQDAWPITKANANNAQLSEAMNLINQANVLINTK